MTVEIVHRSFGGSQEVTQEVNPKYEAALSLANTLAETEETNVTAQRIAAWRQDVLFEWLTVRWGYEWDGKEWVG